MKILHIVAGDLSGGAARGAYWLHRGLKAHGIDSKVFTNSATTLGDKTVISTDNSRKHKALQLLGRALESFLLFFYPQREDKIFSTGFCGIDFTSELAYKEADIIHLHWINANFVNIKHLSKVEKPIVWTIRDMWPMTGGCHYSMDCKRYQIGCGKCIQLRSNSKTDLSRIVLNRKKKYLPENIQLVSISNWMEEKAKESDIFKEFKIKTIFNNINSDDFFPVNKSVAQNLLGIDTPKKIILLGAANFQTFYKGFSKFVEAVKNLNPSKYFLCFFGNMEKSIADSLGFEYKNFGFLYDAISLRLLYSSADVFVAPSLMDAFGKTLPESMACETPVVCFNATGPRDIVHHKVNGYKAEPFQAEDIAKGIEWVITNNQNNQLGKNAREKVLKCFDSKVVAKQYIELYQQILSKA